MYKEKGSKFLAFAYPVSSEAEIKEKVDALRKSYFDAKHHCFAYRLGIKKEITRANDDGEPAHSAGNPILGQIVSHDLSDILIVVVRYFGGILLGVGGLIHAYRTAASDALDHATIITTIEKKSFEIRFDYGVMNDVMMRIKKFALQPYEAQYADTCSVKLWVRSSLIPSFQQSIQSITSVQIIDSSSSI